MRDLGLQVYTNGLEPSNCWLCREDASECKPLLFPSMLQLVTSMSNLSGKFLKWELFEAASQFNRIADHPLSILFLSSIWFREHSGQFL